MKRFIMKYTYEDEHTTYHNYLLTCLLLTINYKNFSVTFFKLIQKQLLQTDKILFSFGNYLIS